MGVFIPFPLVSRTEAMKKSLLSGEGVRITERHPI